MAERVNIVSVIIGGRGTGKTTYLKEKILKVNRLPKVLVMDTFPHPSYEDFQIIPGEKLRLLKKGNKRVIGSNTNENLDAINQYYKNGLLVFEDCTKYIKANVQDSVRNLLIDSKQKNLDIILMYHSIGQTPPDIFRLCDFVVLFKTGEQWDNSWKKIPNAHEVKNAFEKVNEHPSKYHHITIRIGA